MLTVRVAHLPGMTSCARSGQAELHPSSDISSCRSGSDKGPDLEDGAGRVSDPLQTRPHSATHRTLTGDTNPQAHWRFGWTRSQCITVAQLRTGHSQLLASYLHRIGQQQSPVCPYCGGDDETAQNFLLCCPSHASARTSTNYINSTDPQRTWSFLESIGAVTRLPPPPTENDRERSGRFLS